MKQESGVRHTSLAASTSKYPLQEAHAATRRNCHTCHAPAVDIGQIPLINMYNLYQKKGLRRYLKKQIAAESGSHPHIELSKKEIRGIILFLEESKDGTYGLDPY